MSFSPNNSTLSEPSLTLRKSYVGSKYDDEMFNKVSSFFFEDSKFQEKISNFAGKYAFDYDPHVHDYSLDMTTLHEKFVALIDEEVNNFLESQGWSQDQFFLASRRAFLNHENGPKSIFLKLYVLLMQLLLLRRSKKMEQRQKNLVGRRCQS